MAKRERHPIPDAPDWPLERRLHHLEIYTAQLWDHVWWISLPFWRRWFYRLQGFRAPIIESFYVELD